MPCHVAADALVDNEPVVVVAAADDEGAADVVDDGEQVDSDGIVTFVAFAVAVAVFARVMNKNSYIVAATQSCSLYLPLLRMKAAAPEHYLQHL